MTGITSAGNLASSRDDNASRALVISLKPLYLLLKHPHIAPLSQLQVIASRFCGAYLMLCKSPFIFVVFH